MIRLRKSEQRGHAEHGWLNSKHTFSFGDYYDPSHMGFRSLRVINEDRVQPSQGFGTHGHKNMEIISYVLDGALEHKDSMGTGSVIKPGDVQRMSAGQGVLHSEFNHSKSELVHFLQIWVIPAKEGGRPGYEQKHFTKEDKKNYLRLIGSQDGREGSVTIQQDVALYASVLDAGKALEYTLKAGRGAWVQVTKGNLTVNGQDLRAGDGVTIEDEKLITLASKEETEFLLFDLA